MSLPAKVAAALTCGLLAFTLPALAAAKKDKKDVETDAKPALVATYGDWSIYHSQSGKSRICYALASPKARDPDDDKRASAYAFISERPAEQVRNEVSFVMGFDVAASSGGDSDAADKKPAKGKDKEKDKKPKAAGVKPTATIGDQEYELLPKGGNLWVKNPAEESQFIDEMRKGSQLKIRAAAKKGGVITDTYSLSGFKQAIDRALKDCPAN